MLQIYSLKKLFFLIFINATPYQKEPVLQFDRWCTGRNPAGALCVSFRVSFAATHTAMPPLLFAPLFGYIGCHDVQVRL